jgi:hypothetical protein
MIKYLALLMLSMAEKKDVRKQTGVRLLVVGEV